VKLAHRIAYQLATGEKLEPSDFICHSCDNPPCCNPRHLVRADAAWNSTDMLRKSRHWVSSKIGEKNGRAKLTAGDIRRFRSLHEKGAALVELASRFAISPSHASRIAKRVAWGHL